MLMVRNVADRANRMSLEIEQLGKDGNSYFSIRLLTCDLPASFLAHDVNRKATMSLIDGNNVSSDDTTLVVPMIFIGSAISDGKQISYYRQRFEEPDNQLLSPAPSVSATCRIVANVSDDTAELKDPNLIIVLSTQSAEQLRMEEGDFSAGSGLELGSREHVERNENANGGLDLRVGDTKNDSAMHEREEQSQQIIPGVDA